MSERKEKFTPGPWGWVISDYSMATLCGLNSVGEYDGLERHVLSSSPCKACQGRANPKEWVFGRCLTPKLPDAHLIAAAPELYEALNAIVHHSVSGIHMNNLYAKGRAALAKARGEA